MTVPEMELGRYDVGWNRGLILLISKGSSPFFPGCLYSTISDRSNFSKHYNNGIITQVELCLLPFIFWFRWRLTFFFSRNGNGDNCTRMEETEGSEEHSRAVLLLLQTNYMLQNTYTQNRTHDIQWAPCVVFRYGGGMRWATWAVI